MEWNREMFFSAYNNINSLQIIGLFFNKHSHLLICTRDKYINTENVRKISETCNFN